MPISRRSFVQAAGASAVGSLFVPFVSGRGLEAFGAGALTGAAAARHAPGTIRLNSNENPNGPGSAALDAIGAGLGESSRYPRDPFQALRAAIAAEHNVAVEQVIAGCGSTDILRACVYAFSTADRALVTALPTFESPVNDARRIGASVREVPVRGDLQLDLDAMAAASPGAGLVYLCNPNNPTSTVHGAAAIRDTIARIQRDSPATTILVDEAYHEYVDDPSYATAIPLAVDNPRVVVARTFSKVFGMAGLRVGYAIGHPDTIKAISTHTLSLAVNHLGAVAATAALGAREHVAREQLLNREARAYTIGWLRDAGLTVAPSQANFVMTDLKRDAQPFRDACKRDGVLIGRAFPPLATQARISIGTMDEMRRATEVFRRALATA
jgi:histidinol-phosphate aminotransferase